MFKYYLSMCPCMVRCVILYIHFIGEVGRSINFDNIHALGLLLLYSHHLMLIIFFALGQIMKIILPPENQAFWLCSLPLQCAKIFSGLRSLNFIKYDIQVSKNFYSPNMPEEDRPIRPTTGKQTLMVGVPCNA